MQTRPKKTMNRAHWIELSLGQELALLPIVVAILGLSVYQLTMFISWIPFMIASMASIIFCIIFLLGIGRKVYSKAYLVILFLMSLAPLAVLAALTRGYVLDLMGEHCMAFGGHMSCIRAEAVSIWIVMFYSVVPLAILSVIAVIFQLRRAR